MEIDVNSLSGESSGKIELPEIFEEEIRPDVIKRAVLSAQSSRVRPKGANPRAGMETSAETPPKGSGSTRVRRVKGRRYQAAGRGAWAPFTYGGRSAHPLKAEEKRGEGINKKEKNLAICSAISATKDKDLVSSRGHVIEGIDDLPIIVENEFEDIEKTREVKDALEKLGVWEDVERAKKGQTVRAGRGKARGRRYRKKVGPLLVVGEDRGIIRGARNLPGVDVVLPEQINAELLAPGGDPARLTVWTESAIEKINRRFFS